MKKQFLQEFCSKELHLLQDFIALGAFTSHNIAPNK